MELRPSVTSVFMRSQIGKRSVPSSVCESMCVWREREREGEIMLIQEGALKVTLCSSCCLSLHLILIRVPQLRSDSRIHRFMASLTSQIWPSVNL